MNRITLPLLLLVIVMTLTSCSVIKTTGVVQVRVETIQLESG